MRITPVRTARTQIPGSKNCPVSCKISSALIYGLALLPVRAVLLIDYTFVYTVLSGSSLSVLALTAENEDNVGLIVAAVLVAAVSMVKFLPLFFLIGKRWGPSFIDYSFMGHPPLFAHPSDNHRRHRRH